MKPLTSLTVQFIVLTISIIAIVSVAQDQLFKINKLNLIWAKAQHSLGPTKLKDLKSDLTKHEVDEINLKKMKAHNQDKDGLFEASVRRNLLSIMSKYKIERYYDDVHPQLEDEHDLKKDNFKRAKDGDDKIIHDLKATFRDKRLDKLWRKAERSGFTQEGLMVLHEEFQHLQEKLDEHYDTMNMIEEEINQRAKTGHKWENSIEANLDEVADKGSPAMRESPSQKKARLSDSADQALKEKYRSIKKGIEELREKVVSGKATDGLGPFEEQPVNELWLAAVNANFTTEELQTFSEELEHYETRLKKLKHYEMQLERDAISSEAKSKDVSNDDGTKHVRKRVKELLYKVEKTHRSLEKQISSRREEL